MLRYKFLIFFLTSIVISCYSQEDSIRNYQLGIKRGYGFIISHSPTMEYITEQHVSKIELSIEKNTFGNKDWHQHHGFPRIGLSFTYFNFNNEKHLGKGYSLYPYFNFKVFDINKVQLRFKPAIGIGYIEKPFDSETNFKNAAIGSHLNIFFSFLAETEIKLSKNSGLLLGVNFSHFSNTAFKNPNLGINIPTIEAGIFHSFGSNSSRIIKETTNYNKEKAVWMVNAGTGFNEINPPNEKKYLATAISIVNEKRLNFKSSIAGSLDFFYNPSHTNILRTDSTYIDDGFDNLQIGISFHHVLHFGKLQNYIQFGYYLKNKNKDLGNIYQIVGGRYQINNRWNALLIFKTHLAKAEYLMVGAGLKLGRNEK